MPQVRRPAGSCVPRPPDGAENGMDNLIRVVDVRDCDAFAQPLYEFASVYAHLARTSGNRA